MNYSDFDKELAFLWIMTLSLPHMNLLRQLDNISLVFIGQIVYSIGF